MTKKIITIGDIEFIDSNSGGGGVSYYETPELDSYNKNFKASIAYLPIEKRCFKIIRWNFSEHVDYVDDRFPQYDVFEIEYSQFNSGKDPEHFIDLTETQFEEWLFREQLQVI